MRARGILLSSAAVLALSFGSTVAAGAAGLPASTERFPEWYFSVEGGALSSAPTTSTDISTDKLGLTPVLGNDTGTNSAFAFGHTLSPRTDWRVALSYSQFGNNAASVYDSTAHETAVLGNKSQFSTADFEFGFHPVLPSPDEVRLFAGLRALSERDSAYSSDDKLGSSSSFDSSFTGIGPRAGFEVERKWADGTWGIVAGGSASAIFGHRDSDSETDTVPSSSGGDQTAYNLGGSVGLSYHPKPAYAFVVGVRADQWWNLRGVDNDAYLTTTSDIFSWGPYLKFSWAMK